MNSRHHLSKSVTYGLIALASIFIIGASFWYKGQYTRTVQQPSLTATSSPSITKNTIQEKNTIYDIEVTYPVISKSFEGSDKASKYLTKLYAARVLDFKKQAKESHSTAPIELLAEKGGSYYTTSFQEVASTSRYISLAVESESYFIGMAHPSHGIDTFIFDKKLKKLVTPQELFMASSSYQEVLSESSRAFFEARNSEVGYDGLKINTTKGNDGLLGTDANFSKMLPTDNGLIVYFTEYQVAPYVAGPQQALLPYSALKGVINEDGVIGEYK